jgi:hypothetical protein
MTQKRQSREWNERAIARRPFLLQFKVTTVVAADKCLGANELLVSQLGKRIVEVAPGRRTEINGPLLTEVIRDWAPDDIEGCSVLGGYGFDEGSREH